MPKKRNQAWNALNVRVALTLLKDPAARDSELALTFLAVAGHEHRDLFRLEPLAAKCEAGDDLKTLQRMKAHMDRVISNL